MEREEAIRRIKAWNLDSDDMEVLATVIPELVEESEEEKIIGVLIWVMEGSKKKRTAAINNVKIDDILAWLKKRKEEASIKESEGDRIRKEIVEYLELVDKGEGDYAHPMISRWIAYLEKQKKQRNQAKRMIDEVVKEKLPEIIGEDYNFIKNAMAHKQCYNCALKEECKKDPMWEPIGTCHKWTEE